jgi:hypothetical protein
VDLSAIRAITATQRPGGILIVAAESIAVKTSPMNAMAMTPIVPVQLQAEFTRNLPLTNMVFAAEQEDKSRVR